MKKLPIRMVCLAVLLLLPTVFGEGRYALTVGIDTYDRLGEHAQLEVAVKDATTMTSALQSCAPGFSVTNLTNATHQEFSTGFETFAANAAGADCVVFYFAGHGIEFHGENYLLLKDTDPNLDAKSVIQTKNALELRALSMKRILRQLNQLGAKLTVIVLDACRDNPLESTLAHFSPDDGVVQKNASDYIISKSGIGRVNAPAGMLISYSADSGQSANDGLFTDILAKNIQRPGLSLMEVFTETRTTVSSRSRLLAQDGSGVFHEPAEYLKLEPSALNFKFHHIVAPVNPKPEKVSSKEEAERIAMLTEKIQSLKQALKQTKAAKPTRPIPQTENKFWHFTNSTKFVFEARLVAKTKVTTTAYTVTMDLGDRFWVLSPSSLKQYDSIKDRIDELPQSNPADLVNRVTASLTANVPPEVVGNLVKGATNATNYLNRKKEYAGSEQINEALIRWLSTQAERSNELGTAWYNLARSFEYQKKWSQAKDAYLKQLENDPANTSGKVGLFRCYNELGMTAEAKGILYTLPRNNVNPGMFASVNDLEGAAKLCQIKADEALLRFQQKARPFPRRELMDAVKYSKNPADAHPYTEQLLNYLVESKFDPKRQFLELASVAASWWMTSPSSVSEQQKFQKWLEIKEKLVTRFAGSPRMDWRLAYEMHQQEANLEIDQVYRRLQEGQGIKPVFPEGVNGPMPHFNGRNTFISIPPLPFNEGQQFTIEAWVYGWRNMIFCQGKQGDPENSIWGCWAAEGHTHGWESGKGRNHILAIRPFPFDQWEHIALVYDGREQRAYLNGELYTANSPVPKPGRLTDGRRFFIGAQEKWDRRQTRPTGMNAKGVFHSLRVSKEARYSGVSFQPPTALLSDEHTLSLVVADGKSKSVEDHSSFRHPVEVSGIRWQRIKYSEK